MTTRFLVGDVFERMAELPDASFDLIVTSPPFGWLRSYLPDGHPQKHLEIGSEPNPAAYLDVLLSLTAEWRRLLAPHGSLAVELGDTYAGSGGAGGDYEEEGLREGQPKFRQGRNREGWPLPKSLCFIPELYGACLAYGRNLLTGAPSPAGQWRVRNVKPWIRSNPPVGALGDKERPATSYITVACVSRARWFDLDAVRTASVTKPQRRFSEVPRTVAGQPASPSGGLRDEPGLDGSGGAPPLDWWHHVDAIIDHALTVLEKPQNGQSENLFGYDPKAPDQRATKGTHLRRALEKAGVLTTLDAYDVSPRGYQGAHYAVWPPELVKLMVQEMCPPGGTVLDPFGGSGTTLMVCSGLGRNSVGIDLDERNADLARERVGMFLEVEYPDREVSA